MGSIAFKTAMIIAYMISKSAVQYMKHFIYHFTIFDTCVYKGDQFKKHSILDVHTHFKPTETFQYTHFDSFHPPGVRKGFIKGQI